MISRELKLNVGCILLYSCILHITTKKFHTELKHGLFKYVRIISEFLIRITTVDNYNNIGL